MEDKIRFVVTNPGTMSESAAARPADVELHIEELVLHGFRPGDRYAIADAVQREFTHLLDAAGATDLASGSMHVGRLDAGRFRVMPRSRSVTVGEQVARAVYGSLISSPRHPRARDQRQKGSRPR